MSKLHHQRREYGHVELNEDTLPDTPMTLFSEWVETALEKEPFDATAFSLATVDAEKRPDNRILLLKDITQQGTLVFYTNYNSAKGKQLAIHQQGCMNFYWPACSRQVRLYGTIAQCSTEQSKAYFHSRPRTSQLSALASPQSKPIDSRSVLEEKINALADDHKNTDIPFPPHWGGFELTPQKIEFWQGRNNRLHDRICYLLEDTTWSFMRLAP